MSDSFQTSYILSIPIDISEVFTIYSYSDQKLSNYHLILYFIIVTEIPDNHVMMKNIAKRNIKSFSRVKK